MPKLPFMKFYPADFLIDVQRLTMEERGIWITLLSHIWIRSDNGTLTFDASELSSILGGNVTIFESFLHLMKTGVGDIKTIQNDQEPTIYEVHSRRISRDKKELKLNSFRVSKHRSNGVSNGISNKNVMPKKSEAKKSEDIKDKDIAIRPQTPPTPKTFEEPTATPKPLTDVQKVVVAFKMLQGFEKDDKAWDRLYFPRFSKSAAALLAFVGNWKDAVDCCQDIYEKLSSKGFTVTLETITKHAGDWLKDKREKEAGRGILSLPSNGSL